jgi:hypothetical protein
MSPRRTILTTELTASCYFQTRLPEAEGSLYCHNLVKGSLVVERVVQSDEEFAMPIVHRPSRSLMLDMFCGFRLWTHWLSSSYVATYDLSLK